MAKILKDDGAGNCYLAEIPDYSGLIGADLFSKWVSRARMRACAPSRARAVSINLLKYITYYTYLTYLKINLITYSYSYLTVRGKVRGKGEGKGKGW